MKNDFNLKKKKLNQVKSKSQNESSLSKLVHNARNISIMNGKPINFLTGNMNETNYQKKKKSPNFFSSSKNKKSITLSSHQSLGVSSRKDQSREDRTNISLPGSEKKEMNTSIVINNSIIKYQEEALECQLSNSRMKNEICILNEKIKLLDQIVSMIKIENDLLQNKYTDLLNDYKSETSHLRESNHKYKNSIEKTGVIIKSLIGIVIEVIEMFLNKNSSYPNNNINYNNNTGIRNSFSNNNTNNNQVDYSLDVYDSFNGDDEKKQCLIDQIQGVILSKISRINSMYDINFDKEIERIQNWNNGVYMSFRKLSRINDEISNSISKIVNSNSTSNEFDLSVSGQFYNLSPRFNSFDNDNKNDKNKQPYITDNILNELNNCSFRDFNSNSIIMKPEEAKLINNSSKSVNNNFIKILDCSFGEGGKEKKNQIINRKLNEEIKKESHSHNNPESGDYINFTMEDVVNEDTNHVLEPFH